MKIGLLGYGVVGTGVAKIIDNAKTSETKSVEIKKILVHTPEKILDKRCVIDPELILNDPEIDVVCECMGGLEPAHTYIKQALENGKHCITSNKKMLATFAQDLFETAEKNHAYLCFESSVGGGIPWIANIERINRIDEVSRFRGIFNGTTNYILSQMYAKGKDFNEMLKNAQDLGYAERDPSDDIDGMDTRYKVCLSTLSCFRQYVKPEDVITWGIRYINKKDFDWAKQHNLTIKLIGSGQKKDDSLVLSVLPVMLEQTDVLANIPLNFNAIQSYSSTLGLATFGGQGAGSMPTAHAVVQDILDLEEKNSVHVHPEKVAHLLKGDKDVFYIRTKSLNTFEKVIDQIIDNESFLTKKISLSEITKIAKNSGDKSLFLAKVESN